MASVALSGLIGAQFSLSGVLAPPQLRRIYRGVTSVVSTASVDQALPDTINPERSIILCHFEYVSDPSPFLACPIYRILDSNTLRFEKASASAGGVIAHWTVLEFTDGIKVEHVTGSAGPFTSGSSVPLSLVNPAVSFVIPCGSYAFSSSTSYLGQFLFEFSISGSDMYADARQTSNVTKYFAAQVVEWTGATVQEVNVTFADVDTLKDTAISAVDLSRTGVFFSASGPDNHAFSQLKQHALSAQLTSTTNLRLSRGVAADAFGSMSVTAYVVEFPSNVAVHGVSDAPTSLAAGVRETDATSLTFEPSVSAPFTPDSYSWHKESGSSGTDAMFHVLQIVRGDDVRISIKDGAGVSDVGIQVFEFEPILDNKEVTGQVAAKSTVSGPLDVVRLLDANPVNSVSSVTGDMTVTHALAGTVAAQSAVSGYLSSQFTIAPADVNPIEATFGMSGSLAIPKEGPRLNDVVIRGTVTLGSGDLYADVALPRSVRTAKSVAFVSCQATVSLTNAATHFARGHFTSPTNLRIERAGTGESLTVAYEVVEFSQGIKSIQYHTKSDSTLYTWNLLVPVDTSKSILYFSYSLNEFSAVTSNDFMRGRLTSSTTAVFDSRGTMSFDVCAWVIEFEDAVVEHIDLLIPGSSSQDIENLANPLAEAAFVSGDSPFIILSSMRLGDTGSPTKYQEIFPEVSFLQSGGGGTPVDQVIAALGDPAVADVMVRAQVVQFPNDTAITLAFAASQNIQSGNTIQDTTFSIGAVPWNLDGVVVFPTAPLRYVSRSGDTGSIGGSLEDSFVDSIILNTTQVRAERLGTGGFQTTVHNIVIEFPVEAIIPPDPPVVKNVYTGFGTIGAGTDTEDVTIPTVVPEKTVVIVSGSAVDDGNDKSLFGYNLLNSTTVRVRRGVAAGTSDLDFHYQVIEFESGVSVQRGSTTLPGGGSPPDLVAEPLSPEIDPFRSIAIVTPVSPEASPWSTFSHVLGALYNVGTGDPSYDTLYVLAFGFVVSLECEWQVVEFSSGQRAGTDYGQPISQVGALADPNLTDTVAFLGPAASPPYAFWTSPGIFDAPAATLANDLITVAYDPSVPEAVVTREAAGQDIDNYLFSVLEFVDGVTQLKYAKDVTLGVGVSFVEVDLTSLPGPDVALGFGPANPGSSWVWPGMYGYMGRTTATGNNPGEGACRAFLKDSGNTLRVERDVTTSSVTMYVTVLQFEQAGVPLSGTVAATSNLPAAVLTVDSPNPVDLGTAVVSAQSTVGSPNLTVDAGFPSMEIVHTPVLEGLVMVSVRVDGSYVSQATPVFAPPVLEGAITVQLADIPPEIVHTPILEGAIRRIHYISGEIVHTPTLEGLFLHGLDSLITHTVDMPGGVIVTTLGAKFKIVHTVQLLGAVRPDNDLHATISHPVEMPGTIRVERRITRTRARAIAEMDLTGGFPLVLNMAAEIVHTMDLPSPFAFLLQGEIVHTMTLPDPFLVTRAVTNEIVHTPVLEGGFVLNLISMYSDIIVHTARLTGRIRRSGGDQTTPEARAAVLGYRPSTPLVCYAKDVLTAQDVIDANVPEGGQFLIAADFIELETDPFYSLGARQSSIGTRLPGGAFVFRAPRWREVVWLVALDDENRATDRGLYRFNPVWSPYRSTPERALDGLRAFELFDPDEVFLYVARLIGATQHEWSVDTKTILTLLDPDVAPESVLPVLAAQIGVTIDPDDEVEFQRRAIRRGLPIARNRARDHAVFYVLRELGYHGYAREVWANPNASDNWYEINEAPASVAAVLDKLKLTARVTARTGSGQKGQDIIEVPHGYFAGAPDVYWPTSRVVVHLNEAPGVPINTSDPELATLLEEIARTLTMRALPSAVTIRYFATDREVSPGGTEALEVSDTLQITQV